MWKSRTVLLAGLSLLILGCHGEERRLKAEQEAAVLGAEATLKRYMEALRTGDCKTAYYCLSWHRRQEITLEQVESDYKAHRDRYHYRAGAKLERSLYDGFRVVSRIVNGEGKTEFVALVQEDGAWKIESTGRSYGDAIDRAERLGGSLHPEADKP